MQKYFHLIWLGITLGCTQPAANTAKEQNQDLPDDKNKLVLSMVDSIAHSFTLPEYNENTFKTTLSKFNKKHPVTYNIGTAPSDSIVLTISTSYNKQSTDMVEVYLPTSAGIKLPLKQVTDYFGQVDTAYYGDMPKPKSPLPLRINLDKHLGKNETDIWLAIIKNDQLMSVGAIRIINGKKLSPTTF